MASCRGGHADGARFGTANRPHGLSSRAAGRPGFSHAANLSLDTLKSLRLALGAELPASATLDSLMTATVGRPNRYSSAPVTGALEDDELARVLVEACNQGLVSSIDARMLWLVATGSSRADVAGIIGITPEALRQRYSRACSSMRAHVTELVAA